MVVLDEEYMSWLLFQSREDYLLSVVCGTVGVFMLEIELSHAEISQYKASGKSYINELANSIRFRPDSFTERQIVNFKDQYNVVPALTKWRGSE
ncbi:hypothetical protein ACODM8_15130 [Vibrio ostreicida]|uniref:Uncharacterized protein n=1 Tax=Vibrio ostreicida TaxID=526588 RepID=A0ABT8BS72_9VIBR|nr:hypothetical protein [Vibrio ostreicida]MDN3609811.1 hypothetical protein [Vibrio ostreicida]MDN3611318.1 hypothetical protein [Vibrio ostreicida]NPD09259.1 hypothetical protein [Vibrio ostreicida]NPD09366.1 hypothetical protein [Vibrio ostreicida]